MPYRWDRDKPLYRVDGDDIHEGDVFDPSGAVIDRFGEWLEEVGPKGSDGENDDADGYVCGVNGCSRSVDSPEERCWQHQE